MASPNSWPAGLAGTGFELATETNDYFSGNVYWVDTVRGLAANTGLEREMPTDKLATAHTNAVAGDLIVIEAGSAETLLAAQAFNKAGITVIGLGQGANRPRYTAAMGAAAPMFNITVAGVRIYNLYFPASTTVTGTARIGTTGAETEINTCHFEHGTSDTMPAVLVGAAANDCRLVDLIHVVTASRPSIAVSVISTPTDLVVQNITLDGGSYGWTDYAFKVSGAATRMLFNGVTLLHRSDFGITITGTTYKIFGVNASGSSRVVIAS